MIQINRRPSSRRTSNVQPEAITRAAFDARYEGPVLGIDEVGLGCIAGPVYAAGVVIPDDPDIVATLEALGLKDSKLTGENTRLRIYNYLQKMYVPFTVASMDARSVDYHGVGNCLTMMFTEIWAEFQRTVVPRTTLIDGQRKRSLKFHNHAIVKGDNKSLAIAAASVVAKVERDRFMVELAKQYPGFSWESNKGYPSAAHLKALDELGVTNEHRRLTRPVASRVRPVEIEVVSPQ